MLGLRTRSPVLACLVALSLAADPQSPHHWLRLISAGRPSLALNSTPTYLPSSSSPKPVPASSPATPRPRPSLETDSHGKRSASNKSFALCLASIDRLCPATSCQSRQPTGPSPSATSPRYITLHRVRLDSALVACPAHLLGHPSSPWLAVYFRIVSCSLFDSFPSYRPTRYPSDHRIRPRLWEPNLWRTQTVQARYHTIHPNASFKTSTVKLGSFGFMRYSVVCLICCMACRTIRTTRSPPFPFHHQPSRTRC